MSIMRRIHALTVVLAVLLAPALLSAQSRTTADSLSATDRGSLTSSILSAVPRLPRLNQISLSKMKFNPSAKFGYQRMGMTLKTPVPFEVSVEGADSYKGDPVYLRLPEVNLWIGEAGLDVDVFPSIRLFAKGSGNLVQNLVASLSGKSDDRTNALMLKKNPLVWMEVDGGGVYYPWQHLGIVAGLRWDHFDLTIKEPQPLARVNVGSYRNLGLLASDVLSDLWIPYLGCEARSKSLRASLIGSAFSFARVKARTRLRADVVPSYNFLAESLVTLRSPAFFVEANATYKVELASRIRVSFWGKAGWLRAAGKARLKTAYNTTYSELKVGILGDRTVSLDRYNLGGGIALDASF